MRTWYSILSKLRHTHLNTNCASHFWITMVMTSTSECPPVTCETLPQTCSTFSGTFHCFHCEQTLGKSLFICITFYVLVQNVVTHQPGQVIQYLYLNHFPFFYAYWGKPPSGQIVVMLSNAIKFNLQMLGQSEPSHIYSNHATTYLIIVFNYYY